MTESTFPRVRRIAVEIPAVLRDPRGAVGLTILIVLSVAAVAAPLIAPFDPYVTDVDAALAEPGGGHLLGTDNLGRDVLSRLIYGARVSLLVGVVAVALGALVGVATGMMAGYFRGLPDSLLMRGWDVVFAFPGILIGLIIIAVAGPGTAPVVAAVAINNMPEFARIARASTLREREQEYVAAAAVLGARPLMIMRRHVLRNITGPLLVQATITMAQAIMLEAGLSFLGLGAQPPTPTWGGMLSDSQAYLRSAPWLGVFPGVALALLLIGLQMLSDAFSDSVGGRGRR